MSVQFKITGGTPKLGKSLCTTCKMATIVKGQNMEEHIKCDQGVFSASGNRVTFKVAECSAYHPMNMPWLHEMKQIAWNIEARKRGQAGFKPDEPGEIQVVVTKPKRDHDPVDDYPE